MVESIINRINNYLKESKMDHINEFSNLKRSQKDEISHFIQNTLANHSITSILKKIEKDESENIVISKKEAKTIIDNLSKIRQFVISLPYEDD